MSSNAHLLPIALPALRSGPWERRRYWLPGGWTAPAAIGMRARAALIDSTRSRHRGRARTDHDLVALARAEERRARRRARNLAIRDAGGAS